jgi:hypothetical protein
VRVLRLRRRRSGVPGVFLIYHAAGANAAGVGFGATAEAAPDPLGAANAAPNPLDDWGGEIAYESAFALPPQERRHVQRRGRLELGARRRDPHVVRGRGG